MKKRSLFSLSHSKLLTGEMGHIIPITWYEVLPGDTIQQATSALVRISPLVAPVMHPVYVRIHHWFVPNRLIWEDWEQFITGGDDGNDNTTYPYVSLASVAEGTLHNYLGIPPDTFTPNLEVSALPFRAYNLIFNEFYRDQDLVTAAAISTASGADATTDLVLSKCAWPKDYFTTARPWEQKGDEVTIPISGDAPITGFGVAATSGWGTGANAYETDGSGAVAYAHEKSAGFLMEEDPSNAGYPNIRANLAAATGIPINDLRLSLAIQRFREARAQYGNRYPEYLAHEFGIRNQDQRLQRPEYLGGGRNVIQFSEVLSTDGANTGDMYGHGITAMRTNRYRRFIPEHGIVMTLMSVVPKPLYTEALHRGWMRGTKEDYFNRHLQFIGEQHIYNREAQVNNSSPWDIFGYQTRYDEYRYHPSNIAGEFHSTMNHWHYGREYTGDIALNNTFVECTPTKRTQADTGADSLIVMANHSIQARRAMSANPKPKTF